MSAFDGWLAEQDDTSLALAWMRATLDLARGRAESEGGRAARRLMERELARRGVLAPARPNNAATRAKIIP